MFKHSKLMCTPTDEPGSYLVVKKFELQYKLEKLQLGIFPNHLGIIEPSGVILIWY